MKESRKEADKSDRAVVLEIETEERTKFEVNNFLVTEFSRVNENP